MFSHVSLLIILYFHSIIWFLWRLQTVQVLTCITADHFVFALHHLVFKTTPNLTCSHMYHCWSFSIFTAGCPAPLQPLPCRRSSAIGSRIASLTCLRCTTSFLARSAVFSFAVGRKWIGLIRLHFWSQVAKCFVHRGHAMLIPISATVSVPSSY
jgi:hypothetical protein